MGLLDLKKRHIAQCLFFTYSFFVFSPLHAELVSHNQFIKAYDVVYQKYSVGGLNEINKDQLFNKEELEALKYLLSPNRRLAKISKVVGPYIYLEAFGNLQITLAEIPQEEKNASLHQFLISANSHKAVFTPSTNLKANIKALSAFLDKANREANSGEKQSFLNWLLPQANADIGTLGLLAIVATVIIAIVYLTKKTSAAIKKTSQAATDTINTAKDSVKKIADNVNKKIDENSAAATGTLNAATGTLNAATGVLNATQNKIEQQEVILNPSSLAVSSATRSLSLATSNSASPKDTTVHKK